ncbi:Scr1 family TA system antitoxin-like transcriptional regulator [Micromonospora sp. PTRAS2]
MTATGGSMGNETLRVAMAAVGETADSLAGKVRVDPKTAGRWVSQGRIPHARTRYAVAKVLGREVAELWPHPGRRRNLPWFHKWAELERIVAGRLERQAILDAEAPPQLVVVIDEVVLRRVVGDRAVMAGQVAHLAAAAEREHVQVR